MKKIFVLFCLLILTFSVFADSHHSVPLNDASYEIIESAELRGLIPVQSYIKPYNVDFILNLLATIRSTDALSQQELAFLDSTVTRLENAYGISNTSSFKDVLYSGRYSFGNNDTNASVGGKFETTNKVGYNTLDHKLLDSRNRATAYVRGNLFNLFSFDMNFSMHLEKLNTWAYNPLDFPIDIDGKYMKGGTVLDNSMGIVWGVSSMPEISASFFDNRLTLRWGTLKREWGPAAVNLQLSSGGSTMEAFEFDVRPVDWIEYSVIHSPLQKFALETFDGATWPSEGLHSDEFGNMFSAHRLDLRIGQFDFGVYESLIWRKRFELSYLNPLAIYMVVQDNIGDYDNLITGFDLSYVFPNKLKVYAGMSIAEFDRDIHLKTFFKHARNMFAYQFGVTLPAKIGLFSTMNIQLTYVPPFYGSHRKWSANEHPWGNTMIQMPFVNKGKLIGYPLNPDSLEIAFSFDSQLGNGYSLNVKVKDQMRSAQYAVDVYPVGKNNGTTVLTVMNYDASVAGDYADKDFFHNIWNNILDVSVVVEKQFTDFPFSVFVGLQGIAEWKRDYHYEKTRSPLVNQDGTPISNAIDYNYDYDPVNPNGWINTGRTNEVTGYYDNWQVPYVTAMAIVGFRIYY